jgi:hypothetical protein
LGGILHLGPVVLEPFAKGNRSGRNLHGNEEEGKKEETLVSCETFSRRPRISTSLSGEAPLEGRFLFEPGILGADVKLAISDWSISSQRLAWAS